MNKYIVLDEIDSTNTYLMNGGFVNGTVVISLNQTGGKGRSGRSWLSSLGNALALSWQLPDIDISRLLGVQIALGFAVVESLLEYADVRLKWPNDIIYKERKLAGMLIETKFSGNSISKAVFGVGINLSSVPENFENKAAYMGEFCKEPLNKVDIIIDKMINNLNACFDEYVSGELDLAAEWPFYSAYFMKPVAFHRNGNVTSFTEEGITPDGRLIVRNSSGGREVIMEGDIGYGFSV